MPHILPDTVPQLQLHRRDRDTIFLDPLPVGRLWGVGQVTGQVFERLAIRTIGQLRQMPIETLNELFGSSGEYYWRLAHGIDDRRVVPDREAKSISNETTFTEDIIPATTFRSVRPRALSGA